jgi:molybdopterin/thiamine biosynthesis adenylyltransferase
MSKTNDLFLHENLYRGKPVKDLFTKHITVCGVGALGSNLVDNLARQGFSRIRAVDKDRIELHNLNNQCYVRSQVGSMKTAALHSVVFNAVGIEIEAEHKELTSSTIKKFLKGTDLVVDCFDNAASRHLVKDYCQTNSIECLHAGLFEGYGEVVWNDDYVVPENMTEGRSCDNALARNVVLLTVVAATEEIVNFVLQSKAKRKIALTLGDLKIKTTST